MVRVSRLGSGCSAQGLLAVVSFTHSRAVRECLELREKEFVPLHWIFCFAHCQFSFFLSLSLSIYLSFPVKTSLLLFTRFFPLLSSLLAPPTYSSIPSPPFSSLLSFSFSPFSSCSFSREVMRVCFHALPHTQPHNIITAAALLILFL